MNEMTEEQRLLRNLKDAGCDEATIERYINLKMEGKKRTAQASFSAQGIIIR